MHGLDQKNRRVYDEHYSLVPKSDVPRSTFNRPSEFKFTCESGKLIPIYVDEVLPGDVHTASIHIFARLSDLIFPLMDNATLETQAFFIPMRLVWDNAKRFWGEQDNPTDSISYLIPTVEIQPADAARGSIWDFFGIPTDSQLTQHVFINALIPRAYNLIYNEWYRDQNLQTSLVVPKGDGTDTANTYVLRRRNKKHDYFTSALPWPQKGAQVTIPLGLQAPVTGLGVRQGVGGPQAGPLAVTESTNLVRNYPFFTFSDGAASGAPANFYVNTTNDPLVPQPLLFADLTAASAASINTLRLAVQTQKLLETDARGGTRYTEQLRARWGVTPQDARLQRPEYIGGGITQLNTAAIAQTAPKAGTSGPLGSLAGQATFSGSHSFTCIGHEHGYIMVLASLMTRPTYQQGIHRMWTRSTRYDFATPEFMGLGEQAIRNDEIYATGDATIDKLTFGYQERYGEYRYCNNRIAGLFRSTATGNIDEWHLAQQFLTLPTLGATFIAENAPWERVLAGGTQVQNMQILVDALFQVRSTRPLTAFGVPGGIKGSF